jgi:hypothetical protein
MFERFAPWQGGTRTLVSRLVVTVIASVVLIAAKADGLDGRERL